MSGQRRAGLLILPDTMPLRSPKWPFSSALVRSAPETSGLVVLWSDDELVYLRATRPGETIRAALKKYLSGEGRRRPTHFGWEIASDPRGREAELLRELGMPRWNRKALVLPDAPERSRRKKLSGSMRR